MRIYLTNAACVAAVSQFKASEATAATVGPGLALSIMRFPRDFEIGQGRVLALVPPRALAIPAIRAKREHDDDTYTGRRLSPPPGAAAWDAWKAYEDALRARWSTPDHMSRLQPGVLSYVIEALPGDPGAARWDGDWWRRGQLVSDGDTLFCACSRAAAEAGRCHRVIAADLLAQAGWEVVFNGRVWTGKLTVNA